MMNLVMDSFSTVLQSTTASSPFAHLIGGITVLLSILLGKVFWIYCFPRQRKLRENYPLEHTFLMIKNYDRILDLCWEYFQRTQKETGCKTFVLQVLGLPPFVMTNDVENITHVLKHNYENYGKSGAVFKPKFQGLLGDGIFNADGQQWFAHRKTSANLFKLNKFKSSVLEVFHEDLDQVIEVMNRKGDNQPFDFQDLMHRFTLESISRIAFGVSLGCITSDYVQFAADFDYCTASINSSMINPLWRLERYFTPSGWRYFLALRRINRYANTLIQQRRRDTEAGLCEGKNDLLSLYLDKQNLELTMDSDESTSQNSSNANSSSKKSMSSKSSDKTAYLEPNDRNMRDVILNMVIAGRDTTAQALSWAFYRLCIHPEVQEKVRQEIEEVLQQDSSSTVTGKGSVNRITYELLQKMKYTEAVCMETLRLHPSVPKEAKSVMKDEVLPDGTHVKQGDVLSFQSWSMGRDPELWGPNASEFVPERFLSQPKPSPLIFTAFQAGPRTCLGQNFALLEMKCVLVRLLHEFKFELRQPADSVTYISTLTLPIRGGLLVSAKSI